MDTLKFIDLLACPHDDRSCLAPFDLSIDLGANTGYYTEKISVRNFAKNYVMIEANPSTSDVLEKRWGHRGWRSAWFSKQVTLKSGQDTPDCLILTQAISNHSKGELDMCQTEASMKDDCFVPIMKVDDIMAQRLPDTFQEYYRDAQSAFIKIDTEGMDELVIRGMENLLEETRGEYKDGSPRYLVNFMQFEYSPALSAAAKERESFTSYDLESVTQYLESIGFESFIIGPRYLPLSHGSWDNQFKTWTENVENNAGRKRNYPKFDDALCPYCADMTVPSFTADIFAMRSSHPRATEIKVALGACQESKDFDVHDPQYSFEHMLHASR
jgi:FkbM family methyltransferase